MKLSFWFLIDNNFFILSLKIWRIIRCERFSTIGQGTLIYCSRTRTLHRARGTACVPSVTARTPQHAGSRPPPLTTPPPSHWAQRSLPQACKVRLNILFRISLFVRCFIAHSCWHILFIYSPLKARDINLPTFLERLHYLQCLRCCAHCARARRARCLSLHCPAHTTLLYGVLPPVQRSYYSLRFFTLRVYRLHGVPAKAYTVFYNSRQYFLVYGYKIRQNNVW